MIDVFGPRRSTRHDSRLSSAEKSIQANAPGCDCIFPITAIPTETYPNQQYSVEVNQQVTTVDLYARSKEQAAMRSGYLEKLAIASGSAIVLVLIVFATGF